jgi:hypothetical protein
MQQIDVIIFLPAGAVFNAVVALYTILIAIGTTVAVMSRAKIQ